MTISDVVVLIPGFLGFARIGHFSYFASRVGAALRGCLVGMGKANIPVIPVKTCPTEYLADRQEALLHALAQIDYQLGGIERFHLVGHSTGGVDAVLLTGAVPLNPEVVWDDLDPNKVRDKVRSVISIASPHKGTCLALSPLARFFRHPVLSIDKSYSLALVLFQLPLSLHRDEMAVGAWRGAMTDTGSAAAYVLDVLRARTLVDDLQPRHMIEVHEEFERGLDDALVRSVVTMAGKHVCYDTAVPDKCPAREPDAFFKSMYDYTAGSGFDDYHDDRESVEQAIAAIQSAIFADNWIGNPHTALYNITPELNDGLVNSARQLVDPWDSEELLTVVVGDHIDVIGYYPQWATRCDDDAQYKPAKLQSGILHSGSGFSDDQFFAMWHQVAEAIMSQVS